MSASVDLPDRWQNMQVGDALSRQRGSVIRKLQTSEYLSSGTLPIVDQGTKFICGYTNDLTATYPYDLPVVVFGDHTRVFKFVDFPFAIGADGTQCLHPHDQFDPRFFFYCLQGLDLRAEGYARHFKLLKEQTIPLPPLAEQKRIAEVLRSVDKVIELTGELASAGGNTDLGALHRLKKSLLSDLLSGRVRVPE